jgi:hypothetical protein
MLRWLKRTGPDMDLEFVRLCESANEEGERARVALRASGETQLVEGVEILSGLLEGAKKAALSGEILRGPPNGGIGIAGALSDWNFPDEAEPFERAAAQAERFWQEHWFLIRRDARRRLRRSGAE